MKKIILITQGSQAIQLIRTLFSLGYKPNELKIYTDTDKDTNKSFLEFLKYYEIDYLENIDYKDWNEKIVISYSNPYKLKINNNSTFINFHPGLLPKYKGSLSTVHSMINQENEVGGTWHYMTDKIDHGNILSQFSINITDNDTAFSLNHKIFNQSVNCLSEVLHLVNNGASGHSQNHDKGKFYYNKFPNINHLDKEIQKKINYFPPLFK